jgi:hypothetical protein
VYYVTGERIVEAFSPARARESIGQEDFTDGPPSSARVKGSHLST